MTQKASIKKVLKRLLLLLGILVALLVTLGLIYHKDAKDWLLNEIQLYVSQIQSGDLEIEVIELALFEHLPNITVQLKNVEYYEQKDSIRATDQSPILYAEKIYLAFEPWEFIKNRNLRINTISVKNGVADVLTYEDNKTNLEKALTNQNEMVKAPKLDTLVIKEKKQITSGISKPTAADKKKSIAQKKKLAVQLKELHLENITLKYHNPSEQYSSQIELTSLDGMILLNSKGISCDLETSFEITKSAKFPSITEQGPVSLSLNLDFIDATKRIVINKGNLSFENVLVDIKGTYDHKDGNYVDMEFDASSNDIAFLSKLVQEEILTRNKALINKADIVLQGRVKGQMEDNIPEIDINFSVKDLSMEGPAGKGKFKNVGFDGELHTGDAADFSTAIFLLRNLRGETPGGSVSGNFYIKNFQQPYIKSDVNVSLVLDGYDDIFKLSDIDSLHGKINFTSDFDGLLNLENEHDMDSMGSWYLEMEEIGFKYIPSEKIISKLNGTISEKGNEVTLHNLSMAYDSSNMKINGRMRNLYHFIFNKEQELEADLALNSSQLYTSHFILNPNSTSLINDRISDFEAKVKVRGRDNDVYDSYFPTLAIEIQNMSFELDKLPGLSNLEGLIQFRETQTGFSVDVPRLHAKLPIGSADVLGNVMVPFDFKTLDVKAALDINNIPEEYVLDLIKEMNDHDLLNAKNISFDQMTLVNGNLNISGLIETVPFALQKAEITNSNISLKQPDSVVYQLNKLNLELDGLHFYHYPGSYKISGIKSVTGKFHVDVLNISDIRITPIDMAFTGANDIFNMEFATLGNSGSLDKGSLFLDFSKAPPAFKLRYHMEDISIASVIEDYTSEKLIEGILNASVEFSGSGKNWGEVSTNLKGNVNISGDSLIFYGIDMDDLLDKYQSSQKFNLSDVTAFVLAGPLGTAITKGGDFTRLITTNLKPEDSTYVSKALAQWSVDRGVFKTEDMAFSTSANRLAFQGNLDFVNDTIPGFTVYVIDKKGCSLMEQRIYGKMGSLKTGKLKIAKTLLGSVINLVNAVVGKNCKPVYQGAVAHPIL